MKFQTFSSFDLDFLILRSKLAAVMERPPTKQLDMTVLWFPEQKKRMELPWVFHSVEDLKDWLQLMKEQQKLFVVSSTQKSQKFQ